MSEAISHIVYRRRKDGGMLYDDMSSPFTLISEPRRYSLSQPFVFTHKKKSCLFATVYDKLRCKKAIGYCHLDENGHGRWTVVISEKYHVCTPYVFSHGKHIYLIPVSPERNEVTVYKAVDFPSKWEKLKVLVPDCRSCGISVLRFKNKMYLLTAYSKPDKRIEISKFGSHVDLLEPLPVDVLNDSPIQAVYPSPHAVRYRTTLTYAAAAKKFTDKKACCELIAASPYKIPSEPYMFEFAGAPFVHKNILYRQIRHEREGDGCDLDLYAVLDINSETYEYAEEFAERIMPSQIKTDAEIIPQGIYTYNIDEHYETAELVTYKNPHFPLARKLWKNFVYKLLN